MTWNWTFLFSLFSIVAWLLPAIMLFIIPVNRKPSSATAWLLLIFLIPYVGLLIFLLIGSPKLSQKRRAQQRIANDMIREEVEKKQDEFLLHPAITPRYQPFVQLNEHLGGMPAISGNRVDLCPDYQSALNSIADAIDHAHAFVHIEYFALSRDEETACVFDAMERAQQRGVKIRVLLDQLGSHKYPEYKKMLAWFANMNIPYHLMLPINIFNSKYNRIDLRNHRKIVVVDGQVGFTGSQNLIKRNYFRKDAIYYDEMVARITGPVVGELDAIFRTDWYAESGTPLERPEALTDTHLPDYTRGALCQILPSGSGFDDENNLKLFTALFYAAQHKLIITNPYFVPDDSLMTAITSAAQRGVEVVLINSQAQDQFLVSNAQHSYYEQLLKAGIKIYWYHAPILLHAKHITIDDDIAVIGSSNMDIRSFQLNMEVTLVCYDTDVVTRLREVENNYLKKCRLLQLEEWRTRSLKTKFFENISRLTAALQ